jgi:hypothetical protein
MKVAGWLRCGLAFASPLVIVIACNRPTEAVEPAAAREPAPAAGIAPSDAMPEPSPTIDAAAPADAAAPGLTSPPPGDPPSTVANPPAATIARVIALNVRAGAILITVAAGASRGVAKDWRCQLIDQSGRPADGDRCEIVRVDQRVTVVTTKLTADQIRLHARVRLAPP